MTGSAGSPMRSGPRGAPDPRLFERNDPLNWLTNYVRPKIRALVGTGRTEVPENLWHQCSACERMIFHRDLEANQRVCPHCGHHMRVGPDYRFTALLDEGSWQRLEPPKAPVDPLKFRDLKRYSERLKEAQAKTKVHDALEAAEGTIDGLPVVLAVMNFGFMGGSMGAAVGEAFVQAARRAVANGAAFIIVTASGGARMQEGALSLMQMARTTIAVDEVKEADLPYIVILTDPTTGGVTASFAMLGDIHIAEPGAVIGFAGARVIEQTIREKLPPSFQRAEYLEQHGMVDMVVHRFELRPTLARLLNLLQRPRRNDGPLIESIAEATEVEVLPPEQGLLAPARDPGDADERQ
jgi:acetyl-CoA carboxylase carboxyl transferase subunit beta